MRRNVKSRSRKKQKQASIGLQPTIQEEATRFVSVNTSYHWTETQASVNSSSPCFNATQQNFHQWLSGSDDSLLHGCNQGMTTESSIVEAATTSSSNFISSYTSSTPSHYHHLLDTDDNAMLKSSQQDNSFKDDGNLLELEPIPGSNAHQINEDYSTDSAPSKNWVQMHDEALLQYSQSLVQAMADTTNLPPLVIDECDAFEAEKLPFRRDVGLEVIDTFTKDDIWDLLL